MKRTFHCCGLPGRRPVVFALGMVLAFWGRCVGAAEAVSFANDIQPMLEQSCLPCHNATKSEGGLILETPKTILEGGDNGPAIVLKQGLKSLMYETAARTKKPYMPPEPNKAKAPHLNQKQLELLRRWIDQGAKGEARPRATASWAGMPARVVAVSALAASADGRYAVAGRGGMVTVYDLQLQREAARFEAHPDIVSAVAFSPDGALLATASCGEVKLWRRASTPGERFVQAASGEVKKDPKSPLKVSNRAGSVFVEAVQGQPAVLKNAEGKEIAKLMSDREAMDKALARNVALAGARFEVTFLENQQKLQKERLAKIEEDLAKAKKEQAVLAPKRAELEKTLVAAGKKKEDLALEFDVADVQLADFKKEGEARRKDEFGATKKREAAVLALQKAAPEAKSAAQKELEEASIALNNFTKARVAADASEAPAKAKRDALQKNFEDAIKSYGVAAGAVSNAQTVDANVRDFSETAALVQKEVEAYTQSLAVAKETLVREEAAVAQLAKDTAAQGVPALEAAAFSEDGVVLQTLHSDGSLRAWSGRTGVPVDPASQQVRWEPLFTIGSATKADSPLTDRVNALAFSLDGKLLATGSGEPSRSGEIKLWNPATGKLVREIPKPHKDAVLCLDFSSDGRWLASGGADRAVRVWEAGTGKLYRNLEAHSHHVLAVSFRFDARRLASAGADNHIKTWDVEKSDVLTSYTKFTKEVTFMSYFGRGDSLLATSGAPTVQVLTDTGAVTQKTEGISKFVTAAAAGTDGQTELFGDIDGTVWLASRDGKIIQSWRP